MAGYAELYSKCQAALTVASGDLITACADRDQYRAFINESGLMKDYMLWWVKKQGFQSDIASVMSEAFETAEPTLEQTE